MTLVYRKIPQCRVCRSKIGDKIDQALLNREQYNAIIEKFGSNFPTNGPLTKVGLRNHFKHLKAAIEIAAAARQAVVPAAPALSQTREAHPPERQRVFQGAVQTRIDEGKILEHLVMSGLDDLDRLKAPEDGALDANGQPVKEGEFDLVKRDRVRSNTAKIAVASAQVKQLQLQADNDRHRLELGRIAFRMFDLMRRAMQVCPEEFRSLISSSLKEGIRNDDEINALLKEQSARPALPAAAPVMATVTATVDGAPAKVEEA